MIGRTLGHYHILEQLGAGGMGVVYRARDERLDRDVALKVLPAGTLADETARSRFRREALTLSQLNHPNIAVVYDFDTEDGVDFLAMEFVAGETLSAKLAAGLLPEKEVIALGTQIVEALEEAHEHSVIHRDLKPGNVMVTAKGRVKVLDFGLAKLVKPTEVDAATASLAETQAGAVMGTMPYMAPEQLQGKAADARTDIYALGAVLYEMATGRRPFPEKQSTQLIAAILTEAPQPPRGLNGQVSPGLEAIILKSLEKDPARRYQTAKELLEEFGRLSMPGSAQALVAADSVRQREGKALPYRTIGAAGVVALIGLAVLVGLNVGGLRDGLLTVVGASVSRRTVPLPKIQAIAVLPLENLTGDAGQEYFADGMTEELITNLAKISALKVISRTSVMHYKGTQKTIPEIAKELNVDAVVEGSVQRSGQRVRITAQLIQARPEMHLWAESYERDLSDVLALQSEVAQAIANEIKIKVTPQEQTRLAGARPVNPEAHDLYLRGRYLWETRTEEGVRKSLEYYQQALKVDPGYAPAYAGMALSFAILANRSFDPPRETWPRVKDAALKALELDEGLAEAHVALGGYNCGYAHDWATMEKEYLRAIQLNPGYATAHTWHGECIATFGRLDEAFEEIKRAQELDPLSRVANNGLGRTLYLLRRYDEAILQFRKTLELDPSLALAHWALGAAYQQKGLLKEALEEFQKAVELSGGTPYYVGVLGGAYALAGRKSEAVALLHTLEKQSKQRYVSPHAFAEVYAGLGDKDRAIQLYAKAFEERSIWLGQAYFRVDPRFDSWRSDPRFQDLLRRMNFPP